MSRRIARTLPLLALWGALGLGVTAARSEPVGGEAEPPPPANAGADSIASDPLVEYLGELELRTDESFGLEALTISDAEVDSLMRVWEGSGESPYDPVPQKWDLDFDVSAVRYNRVEGLNVMPGFQLDAPSRPALTLFGSFGWGWAADEATWRAGIRARLGNGGGRPTFELAHARDVYSYGSGSFLGNTIAALFFGRDYGDYFRGEGWSASLQSRPEPFRIGLSYRRERQESVTPATDFSLFERESHFRANPAIDPGKARLVEIDLGYGEPRTSRFAASLLGSVAGGELGGDFRYESLAARVVGRRGLWFGDLATLDLRAGQVTGDAPFQALHHLGGFQTLRGYEVNEFPARRFAHARLDYTIGTDLLGHVPYLRVLRFQAVPFADAAAIFETQAPDGGTRELDDPDVRSSAGIGLQRNLLGIPGGVGELRLDIARRLDRDGDDWTYRLLLTQKR